MNASIISIVVPVYNIGVYLEQCLNSIVQQTYKELEIICIDDGSTDDSQEIIDSFARIDSRIISVFKKNEGVSKARNTGLSLLHGDYVMFVDSDDWLDQNACEVMIQSMKKRKADCVMCCHYKEYGDYRKQISYFQGDAFFEGESFKQNVWKRLFGPVGKETAHPEKVDRLICIWQQLFKADICKNLHFVDLHEIGSCEDGLFQIQAYKRVNKFLYIDKCLYHYRKNNDNSETSHYRKYLYLQWMKLFQYMLDEIPEEELGFNMALNNRIALNVFQLVLNENGSANIKERENRIKMILNEETYHEALDKLDVSFMPFYWKAFYRACKNKEAKTVMLYISLINILKHIILRFK